MSPAVDGVSAHEAMDSAYNQGALSGKSLLCATTLGFKQAQTSLNLAPTDLWSGRISIQENATLDDQDSAMIIKEDFSYVRHTYNVEHGARPTRTLRAVPGGDTTGRAACQGSNL